MLEMYKGLVNSPETTITNNINTADTIIYVLDPARVPDELPNLMTLGTGTNAETVKVLSIDGNALTVQRGFQGVAKDWLAGTIIARNFTEYDYGALVYNVLELETTKETPAGATEKADSAESNAKGFASGLTGKLSNLATTVKDNIVAAINELKGNHDNLQTTVNEHLAENVSSPIRPHGLGRIANQDYEEGTFTPQYAAQNGAFTTLTYSVQQGRYTRIGRVVYFDVWIATSNVSLGTATGELRITGLPFVQDGITGAGAYSTQLRRFNALADDVFRFVLLNNYIRIHLEKPNATDDAIGTVTLLKTGAATYQNELRLSGFYTI